MLTLTQSEQIMNGYLELHPEEATGELVAELGLQRGRLSYPASSGAPAEGYVSTKMQQAYLRRSQMQLGDLVCCPNGHEVGIKEAAETRYRCMREGCDWHLQDFCSECKKPYHFRASCGEVMEVSEEWNRWCTEGRAAYLQQMADRDEEFRRHVQDFERRRQQHDADVEALQRAIAQMQADEAWKRKHCRKCPNCPRIIQRVSGCDSMKCGEDYHGGNPQNGCGHTFNWKSAPRYEPDAGNQREVPRFDAQPPEQVQNVRHKICEGIDMTCDLCGSPIRGPLIQCVNCPEFHVCISCDAATSITSSNTEKVDGSAHPAGHVFRVRVTAQE